MRTLATPKNSNESAKQKQHGDSVRSRSVSPLSTGMPLLQRKCACGGGCPRCKKEVGIQTKLKISEPGDKYEQEADRIADEVMRMPEQTIQRQVEPEEKEKEEEMVQRKAIASQITPFIQRQTESEEEEEENLIQTKRISSAFPTVTQSIQAGIQNLMQSGGQPLPPAARAFMEPRFKQDFSGVRIYIGGQATYLTRSLKARAFTIGNNIVFGNGEFSPENTNGHFLLAHELVHTQQQSTGNSVIQRVPEDDSLSDSTLAEPDEIQLEKQPNQIPSEDLVKADSELEKQLNRLNERMEALLRVLFGEQRGDEDIFGPDVSESQLKKARQAVSRYRRITRILESFPQLDIAFAAKWLNVLIFTLRVLREPVKELSTSGEAGALVAEHQDRQLLQIFNSAIKLQAKKVIKRGAKLAKMAEEAAEDARRAEAEKKLPEALAKITSDTQLQTVGMKDYQIDVEIQRLFTQKNIEIAPVKIQVIDAMIKGLKAGKVEDRKSPETPLVALEDRLTTIESQDREYSSQLTNEIDLVDLTRLAETPKGRVRLGRLGLQLAESTTVEGTAELFGSLLPGFGDDLANIVTGRFEQERAIQHLSRSIVHAGGSSELIIVTDPELTSLQISRAGEYITVRKKDFILGVEAAFQAFDPLNKNKDIKSEWVFAPSDLVTFTVAGSGQSVKLAAFGLLHIKDKGLLETFKTWAALLELGVGFTRASIAATKSQLSASSTLTDASKIASPSGNPTSATVSVSQGVKIGDEIHTLSVRQVGGKPTIYLCSDCGPLLTKIDEGLNDSNLSDAVKLQLTGLRKRVQKFDASLNKGKLSEETIEQELQSFRQELEEISESTLPITNKFPDEALDPIGQIFGEVQVVNGRVSLDGRNIPRELDFVITTDNRLIIGRKHTTLSNKADVLAAGKMTISGHGKIKSIDNISGHFRPTVQESSRVPTLLREMGLDLSGSNIKLYRFTIDSDGMVLALTKVIDEYLK